MNLKLILVILIILGILGMPLGDWCRKGGEFTGSLVSLFEPEYESEVISVFNGVASVLDYLTVLHTYLYPYIKEALGNIG